jgi:Ca-activated chloride channel family protein
VQPRGRSLDELKRVYSGLQQQIGYETIDGDASDAWMRLGAAVMVAAIFASIVTDRRVPA